MVLNLIVGIIVKQDSSRFFPRLREQSYKHENETINLSLARLSKQDLYHFQNERTRLMYINICTGIYSVYNIVYLFLYTFDIRRVHAKSMSLHGNYKSHFKRASRRDGVAEILYANRVT